MISAKQVHNILSSSQIGSGREAGTFIPPQATFTADDDSYDVANIPASLTLSGAIDFNSANNLSWQIKDGDNNVLASGSSSTPSHVISSPPTTAGTYTYKLEVSYTNNQATPYSFTVLETVDVTSPALIGQVANGVTITTSGDLTPAIEATLTEKTMAEIAVLNSIVATEVPNGYVVIVVPTAFGSVTDIADQNDDSALSDFNTVTDTINNRTIYVSNAAYTPATYEFKVIF